MTEQRVLPVGPTKMFDPQLRQRRSAAATDTVLDDTDDLLERTPIRAVSPDALYMTVNDPNGWTIVKVPRGAP